MLNSKWNNIILCAVVVIITVSQTGCMRQGMKKTSQKLEDTTTTETRLISKNPVNKSSYFDAKIHYIFFNKKEIRFNDSYMNELLIVFNELKMLKNSCVEIYGYDSIDVDYKTSKKLADLRAEWTKRCLLSEGVDVEYIKIVKGMEPIKLNKKSSAADIHQSRRVEVHVVPCDDAAFKLKNKLSDIDPDNPFKYK